MQKLKNWLNGLSDVLPDLLIGILLYGVACEAVGLIFVSPVFYVPWAWQSIWRGR